MLDLRSENGSTPPLEEVRQTESPTARGFDRKGPRRFWPPRFAQTASEQQTATGDGRGVSDRSLHRRARRRLLNLTKFTSQGETKGHAQQHSPAATPLLFMT